MVIHVEIGRGGGSSGRSPRPPWLVYAPGAFMILLGIMILLLPQLLQILVGGACIAAGIALVMVPMRLG